ncbi:RICIN domain-containing protein [Streptomyces cinerochromogenes]|uniref:RICIN domain-containing protein n=1 Tax=Streptomyces cinerochromogenes TaxID=66422 RepID=A0ABW7B9C1_9ACTN
MPKPTRLLLSLAATLGLTAVGVATAGTASAVEPNLVNSDLRSGVTLCATPYGGNGADGTYVTQWTCNGDSSQRWSWSGSRIVNQASGKCLTPSGGGGTNGTILTLWTCNGDPSQSWDYASGYLRNKNSGKFITSYGGSASDGANLTLWEYNGTDAQHWR